MQGSPSDADWILAIGHDVTFVPFQFPYGMIPENAVSLCEMILQIHSLKHIIHIEKRMDGMGLVSTRVLICAAHEAHAVIRIIAGEYEI